jgi:hypothetical protein
LRQIDKSTTRYIEAVGDAAAAMYDLHGVEGELVDVCDEERVLEHALGRALEAGNVRSIVERIVGGKEVHLLDAQPDRFADATLNARSAHAVSSQSTSSNKQHCLSLSRHT